MGKIPEMELLEQKLLIAKLLLGKRQFPRKKIEAILAFLRNVIVFKDTELNRTFDTGIDDITGKTNTMGIFETLAEIRAEETKEEERTNFVRNLLLGTDFSDEKIASLANVSLAFVEEIKAKIKSGQAV